MQGRVGAMTNRHALEKIGMEANKLVRLLLDDLGPDGRPEVATGTNGHPVNRYAAAHR
jgi:hypothetical protein